MKTQVATEFILITALALSVLIPLTAYLTSALVSYQEQLRLEQANQVVKRLGSAADWVWLQGSPAQLRLELCLPAGVQSFGLNEHLHLKLKLRGGITDITYQTIATLNGTLPLTGCHQFLIKAKQDCVNITVL